MSEPCSGDHKIIESFYKVAFNLIGSTPEWYEVSVTAVKWAYLQKILTCSLVSRPMPLSIARSNARKPYQVVNDTTAQSQTRAESGVHILLISSFHSLFPDKHFSKNPTLYHKQPINHHLDFLAVTTGNMPRTYH